MTNPAGLKRRLVNWFRRNKSGGKGSSDDGKCGDSEGGAGASDGAREAESVQEELDFRMRMAMETWSLTREYYSLRWYYIDMVLPDIKYRNLDDPSNPARMYYVARVLPCIDGQYGGKGITCA